MGYDGNELFIGIDLGTSSVKVLVVDIEGKVLSEASKSYDIMFPKDGWSEQNPNDWFRATIDAIKIATSNVDKTQIKGISFGGQMHGLVVLDENNEVIRPAILWNDGRTFAEVDYLNNVIGKDKLISLTGNFAFAGFTAPKILWLKNNEQNNFNKISKIMLPKDYISFKLTGLFNTDYSDASGTLLLDVLNKTWSREMCDICGISLSMLPKLNESYSFIGYIKEDIAKLLNLNNDVMIIAGGADNALAAIGTGSINNNQCNISLGTSGTIFVSSDKFVSDKSVPIHSFNHANGKYCLLSCILSAASCNKWWIENILDSEYQKEYNDLRLLGENEVFFLPYLMGERCPYNDTSLRGAFIGMRPNSTKEDMTYAILEGVGFALRDCLDIIREKGIEINEITLCGGGAKNKTWANILCNILNVNLKFVLVEQGPGYGAAILAMVGCGYYDSIQSACRKIIKYKDELTPDKDISRLYNEKYEIFKELVSSLKGCFHLWNK